MKLQSQTTQRFDGDQLRRLARASRPWRRRLGLSTWIVAGLVVGAFIVCVIRFLD